MTKRKGFRSKKSYRITQRYEIKDEKTKKTVKGNSYAVRSVDTETGEVLECPVKPFRSSDKTILGMITG